MGMGGTGITGGLGVTGVLGGAGGGAGSPTGSLNAGRAPSEPRSNQKAINMSSLAGLGQAF